MHSDMDVQLPEQLVWGGGEGVVSVAQGPVRGKPSALGPSGCHPSVNDVTLGQSTPSANSQAVQNWEEWLMYQRVVLLFRRTQTGWRIRMREIS